MLKDTFVQLSVQYTPRQEIIDQCWNEIAERYSAPDRYYHTLSHLRQMYSDLSEVKDLIRDWNTLLYSVFYHDIIYAPSSSQNEENSAELARGQLASLKFLKENITKCHRQIIATKHHHWSNDPDTNFLTDADLSILGKDWPDYLEYSGKIRKEYAFFPDSIYIPGRIKVLEHFFEMTSIFKTAYFKKYEEQARQNIQREIVLLRRGQL